MTTAIERMKVSMGPLCVANSILFNHRRGAAIEDADHAGVYRDSRFGDRAHSAIHCVGKKMGSENSVAGSGSTEVWLPHYALKPAWILGLLI